MSVIDDIISLEERVQAILDGAGNYKAVDDYTQGFIDAVQLGLENITDIDDPERVRSIITDALTQAEDVLNAELPQSMRGDAQRIIDDTIDFYREQGLRISNIAQAVQQRRDFQRLNALFAQNIAGMESELLEATIEAAERAIQQGDVSRIKLRDEILDAANTKTHYADTNAKLLVSGYNRISRLEMRDSANLSHGFYYGSIRNNTRPFCSMMVGKTLSREQISALSNGQGLDVEAFCGGYNCIHSWMWVNPEWDEELERSLYNGALQTIEEGRQRIVVPE